ncbi:MAG: PHP domain-containing protein [Clostridia bacterium]|nr:PHP domain-containing protein [Clostridia bacterium]
MSRYFYDLHIHSCASPCADNDMTPNNIAGMAALNGLGIAAITDHNTCGNCKAFFAACKRYGVVPIAGMELSTSEDVHAVCLFPELEAALDFGELVKTKLPKIANRPEIFGDQHYLDEDDEIIGEEELLLINATALSLDEAADEVRSRGGVIYPAHIDREANGIITMLGAIPPEPGFACAELADMDSLENHRHYLEAVNIGCVLCNSDAHYLWDINGNEHSVEIDDEPYSSALVRARFIEAVAKGNL